ncbi:PAS domain S-box protein [Halorientalis halophila]|uniref:PAS domain S-box protein n=1 Tax=Halorientalis halophila TaxID=3108499 RepID=UPI00300A87B3
MSERDTLVLVGSSEWLPSPEADEESPLSIRRVTDERAAIEAVSDDVAGVLIADPTDAARRATIDRLAAAAGDAPVLALVEDRQATDDALLDAGATGIVTPESVPRLLGHEGPELLDEQATREAAAAEAAAVDGTSSGRADDAPTREAATGAIDGDGVMLDRDPQTKAATLERYDTIVNTVEDAIYLMDADGRFVAVNDASEDLTGYPRSYLEGRHVSTVLPEADVEEGRKMIRELLDDDGEGVSSLEQTVVTADGTEIPCENRLAILTQDGGFEGSVGVVRDVRDQRERERRLREQRALVEGIFEAVPDVLYAFDEAGEFIRWNDRVPELTGYSDAEIGRMNPLDFLAPEDRDRVREALGEVIANRRIEHLEATLETSDGGRIPHEFSGGPIVGEDGDVFGVAGMGRNVSERVAREAEIERQRDELDELNRINDVIREIDQSLIRATSRREAERVVCDRLAEADTYRFATVSQYDPATDSLRPRSGASDGDGLETISTVGASEHEPAREALRTGSVQVVANLRAGDSLSAWETAAFRCGVRSLAVIPVVFEDTTYCLLTVFADRPDAFDEREEAVLGELGETLGYALASIEREEREQLLTTLQGSTEQLIGADSKVEVCERVVGAVSDVLETASVGVFRFDAEAGELVRAGATDGFTDLFPADRLPDPETVDPVVWTAFLDDETVVFDGTEPTPLARNGIRSGMVVPLGDHALLVAISTEATGFDGELRRVLELFATSAEAALDRVEGEADLRARDAELESQNRQLRRQVKINEVIRGVDEALVDGTTRTEIERAVCEQLVSEGAYRFAWIGQYDAATEAVVSRTWAGEGVEYLDAIGADSIEPSHRTLGNGEPVVVPRVSTDLHDESWRQAALLRGFRSVVSVPLVYENYTYGVLSVYADESEAFGETERPVFAELGDTIGNAINGIETKQSLLGDEVLRLKLRLDDETSPLVALARSLDCTISLEGVNTWTAEGLHAFVETADVAPERVDAALDDAVAVAGYRHVTDRAAGVYEIEFADQTVLNTLLEHGGQPRDLTVDADGMVLVVDVSHEIQVRELIEAIRGTYPTVELVARKDVTRELQSAEQLRGDVLGDLTDRQREVLTTAHLSGYFERPRESTGQDIADSLDISQPAVNRHLRVAQRTVFDWLLSGTVLDDGASDS